MNYPNEQNPMQPPAPPQYIQPVMQYVPVQMPVAVPVAKPAPLSVDRRDKVFFVLFLAWSILAVNLSVFGGFALGFTVSAVLLCTMLFLYHLRPALRMTPFALICLIAAVGFSIPFSLYNSAVSRFWLFCAFSFYLIAAFSQMTESARWSFCTFRGIASVCKTLFFDPWEQLPTTARSLSADRKDRPKNEKAKGIWLGILCAVPVLAVVLPLLIASDAAYEALLHRLLDLTPADLFGSLILGVILFVPLFSLAFAQRKRSIAACKNSAASSISGKVSSASVSAFLAVIAFVYLTYLLVQPVYFIGAFRGILPQSFTMAEYARRGFFELTAICAINLLLLFVCLLIVRRNGTQLPTCVKVFSALICVFSMAFSVFSIAKMIMYIGRFSMTRMRVCTLIFMVLLFVFFLCVLLRLLFERFAYMKFILILTAVIGLTVGFADIDTVIARYNTHAYLSGGVERIDVEYLARLSDGAVESLVELSQCEDRSVAQRAHVCLMQRMPMGWLSQDGLSEYENQEQSLRSYNYSHQKALDLLEEYLLSTRS